MIEKEFIVSKEKCPHFKPIESIFSFSLGCVDVPY
jgi:hypothetical protein